MQNINLNEPDKHLVKALKEIKWPIINFEGHKIFLRERNGNKGNDLKPFLQIVTEVYRDRVYITTLYPVNKMVEKKFSKPN